MNDRKVRVLLDCAGIAQVRWHRTLVRPVFELAIQLRQQRDRHPQFAGEQRQSARDLREPAARLSPVIAMACR